MTRKTHILFWAGGIFLLLAAGLMQVLAGYAGDKDWLLYAARMTLAGRVLDVDIIEVNPPLIIWLYWLPSWLAAHAPFIRDYQALGLLGLACCLLSVTVSLSLLKRHPQFAQEAKLRWKAALFFAALFVFYTMPVYFFDREHIMLVMVFPYLLRFAPSLAGERLPLGLRAATGGMAAIGFCIKPYAFILFAAVQVLYVLRERSGRILISFENLLIYGFFCLYGWCVWHYAPDYLSIIMPMAFATYSAFSRRAVGIFYAIYAFITAGVSFADFRLCFTTPYRRDIFYVLGVSAALFLYALVNNGWGYTYNPLIIMLLFLSGMLFLEYNWLRRSQPLWEVPNRFFLFGERACLLNLTLNAGYILYCMAVFFITPACDWSSECVKNRPYVQYIQSQGITSFGALSEDFHKWPTLARLTGANFDTRYNSLWMVPKLVTEDKKALSAHRWIIENVASGLADDLTKRKPKVVFVDYGKKFFGYDIDVNLPELFSQVTVFRDAWSHYRYASFIDGCKGAVRGRAPSLTGCRYDIYLRAD